ncbi:MAG: hypothetical protein KDD70_12740 [Bdellovibrionales bacterium]|nr:hypothetical protein [Bdellovibrionales bacterium]
MIVHDRGPKADTFTKSHSINESAEVELGRPATVQELMSVLEDLQGIEIVEGRSVTSSSFHNMGSWGLPKIQVGGTEGSNPQVIFITRVDNRGERRAFLKPEDSLGQEIGSLSVELVSGDRGGSGFNREANNYQLVKALANRIDQSFLAATNQSTFHQDLGEFAEGANLELLARQVADLERAPARAYHLVLAACQQLQSIGLARLVHMPSCEDFYVGSHQLPADAPCFQVSSQDEQYRVSVSSEYDENGQFRMVKFLDVKRPWNSIEPLLNESHPDYLPSKGKPVTLENVKECLVAGLSKIEGE